MTHRQPAAAKSLLHYFEERIGEKFYLNADTQRPAILRDANRDHLHFHRQEQKRTPSSEFLIPLRSVVSVQEVDGLDGVVVYLVK